MIKFRMTIRTAWWQADLVARCECWMSMKLLFLALQQTAILNMHSCGNTWMLYKHANHLFAPLSFAPMHNFLDAKFLVRENGRLISAFHKRAHCRVIGGEKSDSRKDRSPPTQDTSHHNTYCQGLSQAKTWNQEPYWLQVVSTKSRTDPVQLKTTWYHVNGSNRFKSRVDRLETKRHCDESQRKGLDHLGMQLEP